jgi:hypothetical protein
MSHTLRPPQFKFLALVPKVSSFHVFATHESLDSLRNVFDKGLRLGSSWKHLRCFERTRWYISRIISFFDVDG